MGLWVALQSIVSMQRPQELLYLKADTANAV